MDWTLPDPQAIYDAIDATWPPAAFHACQGWTLREGAGGGKRVSAATRNSPAADPAVAAARMRAMGQTPLFMIRPSDTGLDAALAASGYALVDPVTLFAGPAEQVAAAARPGRSVAIGEMPLALMRDIWAEAGIGAGRLAVMARATGPSAYLIARDGHQPGGVAFAAVAGRIAMIHAIEVIPAMRRRGLGRRLLGGAAAWAVEKDADTLALAVTDANAGAIALYRAVGMEPVGRYHYRQDAG